MLLAQPYKGEILPHWRFKTPEQAQTSANKIKQLFDQYQNQKDFVGMDMARKYLQMGYTRSRRYANHQDGKKYHPETREVLPLLPDEVKARSAEIFSSKLKEVQNNEEYRSQKRKQQASFGGFKNS